MNCEHCVAKLLTKGSNRICCSTDVDGRKIFQDCLNILGQDIVSILPEKIFAEILHKISISFEFGEKRKELGRDFPTSRLAEILCGGGGIIFSADFSHQHVTTAS